MSRPKDVACSRCFQDKHLIEWIRERGVKSHCPWCGARNTYVMPLDELGEVFREAVKQIYVQAEWDEPGDSIGFLLQDNWSVFSEKIAEELELYNDLATAILEAGLHPKHDVDEPDYSGDFRRDDAWLGDDWYEEINRVITSRRSREKNQKYPGDDIYSYLFDELSQELTKGEILYRARIHENRLRKDRYDNNELGAPPPDKTKAARANRKGRPVLYLAGDEMTALAEVRAWKGAAVAVAKTRLKSDQRVVDLLRYKLPESPFFNDQIGWKLRLAGYFYLFGEELSRPVMPHEQKILYKPSQHLCDLIRQKGFDGIIFPSAMGPGHNIVLFDPTSVDILEIKYVRVNEVSFQYDELWDKEEIYEETPYDHLLP